MGTMGYKHESLAGNGVKTTAMLTKTQVNLKIIPGVDGEPEICQLVALNLTDITVKGSWIGPGRLHLIPHVNAPVADLPILRIVGGKHFVSDLTLPHGRVLFSRIQPDGGRAQLADGDTVPGPGDLVLAVGPVDALVGQLLPYATVHDRSDGAA